MSAATVRQVKSATVLQSVKSTKKPASKPSVKTEAVAPKKMPVKKSVKSATSLPDGERSNYVAIAAYYIAQRRGFVGGNEMDDWIQAEKEISQMLKDKRITS